MTRKTVGALLLVVILQCLLTTFTVSAEQALVPRDMPFGEVGSSQVVSAVQNTQLEGWDVSFDIKTYATMADAQDAIDNSEIYGAYVTGAQSDTLMTSAAQSFAAWTEIVPLFTSAAQQAGRQVVVQSVKPLPDSDPIGAVVGLLMLPALVGGLLASILVYKSTSTRPQAHRVGILVGYSVVAGLLTALIAGPLIGAFSTDHFWAIWGCLTLVTAAIAFVSAALLALLGMLGTILALCIVTIFGGAGSGAAGAFLLPRYWQYIGAWLPPRQAVNLIRNTLYFDGNNIARPIFILVVYLLVGAIIVGYLGRWKFMKAAKSGVNSEDASQTTLTRSGRSPMFFVVVSMLIVLVLQCLYALNYTSSAHMPVANNMPFGVTGPSSLTTEVQKTTSLAITTYPDETALKTAIDQAQLWGGLVPGSTNTLIVVPTASDLAPLELQVEFQKAATAQNQELKVETYVPVDLPSGDPFGIVIGLMLSPLIIGGYLSASMLKAATGGTVTLGRGLVLVGFSLVAAMLVNLIAGPWLHGYPTDKFWLVWLLMALIILVVAVFAAVCGRVLGAAGTLVTMIVMMLLGNPSSGGANGPQYLPSFWNSIGPFLPPRSGYILLRNTVYFGGHGTAQALGVLLAYLVVFGVILAVLDYRSVRTPDLPVTAETENEAAAVTVPVGA